MRRLPSTGLFSRLDRGGVAALPSESKRYTMLKAIRLALSVCTAALVAACGGGAEPANTSAASGTFDVASGYRASIAAGWSKTFNISGSCAGTMSVSVGPASTATSFEGAPAVSSAVVVATLLNNCSSPGPVTETRYFDASYGPKGYAVQGGNYGVYAAVPLLPSAAKVGDAGAVGAINVFTDSTKSVSAGRRDVSYALEPDTGTTAVLNLTTRSYDAAGVLVLTQQDRYRVAADGALTPLTLDIQYSSGSSVRLIGTGI